VRLKLIKDKEQQHFAINSDHLAKIMNALIICKFQIDYQWFYSIAEKAKELQFRSHALADDYYAIGAEIKHFSELLQVSEIP
jgi:hypothetical protein